MQDKYFRVYFIFLIIINIALKFYGIGDSSLWLDEGYSVNEAKYSAAEIIKHSSHSDNPPLYYLLLHYWTKLFGFSEMAVRSLSATCNVLAVLLCCIFVYKNFNLRTAVYSTLLFTISNENLYYAQETRTYALVVLLTVLSIGFYFSMLRNKNLWLTFGYIVSNILLFYSHYMAFCIPALQVFLALFLFKSNRVFTLRMILSFGIIILALLPWIQYPLSNAPKPGTFWLERPHFSNLKAFFFDITANKWTLTIIFILFVIAFFKRSTKFISIRLNFSFNEIALFTFFSVPVVFYYLIASYIPIFLLRYLLFVSVPLFILIAVLIERSIRNRILSTGVFLALFATMVYSLHLAPVKQEDWRGAVKFMNENRGQGEAVILCASYTQNVFTYYYDRDLFLIYDDERTAALIKQNVHPMNTTTAETLQSLPLNKKVIGVFAHHWYADKENTVAGNLQNIFKISDSRKFQNVEVVIYERD